MTIDRGHILAKLREQREHIEREYGLRMVGLVGSVARGEAKSDSDVDVFVDIIRTPTLLTIAGAEIGVQDAIGAGLPVQFVFREDLRPCIARSYGARFPASLMKDRDREHLEHMLRYAETAVRVLGSADAVELAASEEKLLAVSRGPERR